MRRLTGAISHAAACEKLCVGWLGLSLSTPRSRLWVLQQGGHILWLYAGQALWLEQLCRSRMVRSHFQKVLRTEEKFLVKVQFRTILSSDRDLTTAILTAAVSHYVILIRKFHRWSLWRRTIVSCFVLRGYYPHSWTILVSMTWVVRRFSYYHYWAECVDWEKLARCSH